jgi:hypothetical protein
MAPDIYTSYQEDLGLLYFVLGCGSEPCEAAIVAAPVVVELKRQADRTAVEMGRNEAKEDR